MVRKHTLVFFEGCAKYSDVPVHLAHKIIDGRYKPYLSALDDQNYHGNDVYDAKTYALAAAIRKFGVRLTIEKLKMLT